MNAKRLTYLGLFTALALIMGLLENSLPPLLAFAPGAKMGLANVVSLLALVILGFPDALAVVLARCALGAIFGGNISALMYSLPAGILSLVVQTLLYRFLIKRISIMSISFFGAVVHNATQLLVAGIVTGVNLFAALPLMLAASVIAGLFVGIVVFTVVRFAPAKLYEFKSSQHTAKHKAAKGE